MMEYDRKQDFCSSNASLELKQSLELT